MGLFKKIFGNYSEKEVKRVMPIVEKINALEPEMQKLSDSELRAKTLVASLPVYLNSLTGKGVHVITVNDYLAKRDSEWMGKVYRFLGLSVGLIYSRMDPLEKQKAYNADVTYGTNNEFGFDYLRDNMVIRTEDMVQRGLNYAIVDEIDSILIDEARTPLIISGRANNRRRC